MAAYIVAQLDVKNTDWQKEYGPQAGALVQKHGGKCLSERGPRWSASKARGHSPASCFFWNSHHWSRQKRGTTMLSMLT